MWLNGTTSFHDAVKEVVFESRYNPSSIWKSINHARRALLAAVCCLSIRRKMVVTVLPTDEPGSAVSVNAMLSISATLASDGSWLPLLSDGSPGSAEKAMRRLSSAKNGHHALVRG